MASRSSAAFFVPPTAAFEAPAMPLGIDVGVLGCKFVAPLAHLLSVDDHALVFNVLLDGSAFGQLVGRQNVTDLRAVSCRDRFCAWGRGYGRFGGGSG